MNNKDGYTLSKQWFDFVDENPEKIKPTHGILWHFLIELNNRLKWKEKFDIKCRSGKLYSFLLLINNYYPLDFNQIGLTNYFELSGLKLNPRYLASYKSKNKYVSLPELEKLLKS